MVLYMTHKTIEIDNISRPDGIPALNNSNRDTFINNSRARY